jgi:5-formyltetrahydrofolate cyclo-ligase
MFAFCEKPSARRATPPEPFGSRSPITATSRQPLHRLPAFSLAMNNQSPKNTDKALMRRNLLAARQNISTPERRSLDSLICNHIIAYAGSSGIDTIAGYLAANGEPDITPALADLHKRGCTICVPVVHPTAPGIMSLSKWTPTDSLTPNRFGIDEPADTAELPSERVGLVLMPLLAFSANGQRLGMGGGYFDRAFAVGAQAGPAELCGVAYSFQKTALIEPDVWDVPMNCVITEQGRFTF